MAFFAQTPARCPSIQTRSIKSWSCRTGTRGSRARKRYSFTEIIRSALMASPRCCARSLWLVLDFTGRQSGAGSFPSGWPTKASVAKGKIRTACWATTTSLGASCAQTQATLPGTTSRPRPSWCSQGHTNRCVPRLCRQHCGLLFSIRGYGAYPQVQSSVQRAFVCWFWCGLLCYPLPAEAECPAFLRLCVKVTELCTVQCKVVVCKNEFETSFMLLWADCACPCNTQW